MKQVKVGLIQVQIEPERSRDATLNHVRKLVERAALKEEANIVCLPERWNYRTAPIEDSIEQENGKTMTFMQKLSAEFGIYLISGAIWVHNQDLNKNFISSGVFNPKGEVLDVQRKLHLYLFEKSYFTPGRELKIIKTEFGSLGIAICFDMIFPEVARFFALNGVDLIFTPVLIRDSGVENWHIYLKSRALENRMPICAVNCAGSFSDRTYAGQSLIIDFKKGYETPSMLNIREAPHDKECILTDKVDLKTARRLRKRRLAERLEIDDKIFKRKKE